MKRNEIVKNLLKEGFKESTLVKFTDKQLSDLHERIIGEEEVMISKKDPMVNKKIDDAKKQNKTIEVYEEDDELKKDEKKRPFRSKQKSEVKDWVESIVESNFHSYTSKNEIMELISVKLNEVEVGPNVKKGHNGIPEFMTYDSITSIENDGPTIAPSKPKVKPGTKPKPGSPFKPKPGPDTNPKAFNETDSPTIAPSKPKTKPGTKPKPDSPFKPKPGPDTDPKALKENRKKK